MSDNKFGNFSSIQIPPESTGPEVQTVLIHELEYTGGTGTWILGEVVTGATSGAIGVIIRAVVGATGALLLLVDEASPVNGFQVAEAITSVSGGAATIGSIDYVMADVDR